MTVTPATTWSPELARGAIQLRPDLLLVRAPDGSGRLLDLAGSFHAVDPIAAELLVGLSRGGRTEAVRATARRYRVPEQQVAADLDALLTELPPGIGTGGAARRGGRVDPLVVAVLSLLRRVGHPRLRTWLLLAAARVCFATAGWSRTLRWWTSLPLRGRPGGGSAAEIDRRVRRSATGSVLGHTCKERAVVCLAEARTAGLPAAVVLGLSCYPLATHTWCLSDDDVVLGDLPDLCDAFQPVARYR
ncbi:Transglutaminase-like superfamily protein [Geodermatophilus siccatus]|uniref:Transglutaminase-like superfamily protein n=1 Tax=Geodermatophilus siccatus TaxID=1137991 RepID=A0A1G9NH43_9ACTN|nr:PqqD family protein [Geodermatophilus siccatus]SDL85693.1 Transglutaminase-like superfamily protein [Geodermatophilus siccatus]